MISTLSGDCSLNDPEENHWIITVQNTKPCRIQKGGDLPICLFNGCELGALAVYNCKSVPCLPEVGVQIFRCGVQCPVEHIHIVIAPRTEIVVERNQLSRAVIAERENLCMRGDIAL